MCSPTSSPEYGAPINGGAENSGGALKRAVPLEPLGPELAATEFCPNALPAQIAQMATIE